MQPDIITPTTQPLETPPAEAASLSANPQVITSTVNQVNATPGLTVAAQTPTNILDGTSLEYGGNTVANTGVITGAESTPPPATPAGGAAADSGNPEAKRRFSLFSKRDGESSTHLRKVVILSGCVIAVILLMVGGLVVYERTTGKKNADKFNSEFSGVREQNVDLKKLEIDVPTTALKVREGVQTLVVNGDIAIQQRLSFGAGAYTASFSAGSNFTADQQYLLPDASGTICLDSNNCGFVSSIDLQNANAGNVTTVGTFSGSSQINGASISGHTITFGPADSTNPGMVSTGTQTFAGAKTFSGTLTVQGASITAGTATQAGSLVIADGSSSTVTFKSATQAAATNYDITIPAVTANDTLCLATIANCAGVGGLQATYNSGNTIISTDARDIDFTLADTATDSNFIVNIASGSSSKAAIQLNGADLFRVDSAGIDLLSVDTADFTGATVTFDAGEIINAELQNSQIGVNTGNGLASGGNISLGGSRTLNLGDLTSDWVQNGGYDIVLNNASSELRILESSGALYYGELDVGDLSATRLYTFPDASGEVSLLGQQIDNGELANSSVTITAGAGLSGGGLMSLGGSLSLSVNLGNSIDSLEIVDGTIVPVDLNITNALGAGVNGYLFSYDNTAGKFTLIDGGTLNTGGVDTVNGMAGALNIVGNVQIGVSASLGNINLSLNTDSISASQLAADSVGASELISTAVGAGSYGSASSVATFTVDADGRLTTAATTAISINTSQVTSGILSVDRGGTGAGTFTLNGVLYGNGTSALQSSLAGTSGQLLVASATGVPTFVTISGDIAVNSTGVTTIQTDAIGSNEVAADSLTASDLAVGSVATSEILNNTILATDLNYTNAPLGVPEDNYILTYDNASGGFTWVDSGTVGVTLTEAQVEDYIFDADNGVKTLSSGTLALNSLTYTGNLTVTNGGTGMISAGAAGGAYYSTGTAFANTGVGLAGQCLLSNGAGAPSWGNCGGSGDLAVTLQVAYNNGNGITTTDARNLTFTLADTATDGNFLVNIATSSTGKAAFQYNSIDLLRIDSAGVDLLGVDIADFTGATVTFDAGEIVETEIAQGTLDDSEIQADSLTAASLAPNSVDASELASTTVTLGSYGSASSVATFTVDADGRLTAAGNTAISLNASAISAGILGVDRGGTGAGTFTLNGVLYGNGTSALQSSLAGTSGQLLVASATGVPTFVTISGDIAVTDTGTTTIRADSVALGTDTTGNYVVNNTAGTGIVVSGTSGEAWSPTISLGYTNSLASNSLGSNESTFASTGIIFEGSTSDGFETLVSLTDPTADNTITLPNASGTFAVTASGNVALSAAGNISITGQIPVTNGGTGQSTFTSGGILLGNGTGGILDSGVLSNGQILIGDGSGAPTIGVLTQGNGITVTNGAGTIAIASTLGTDIVGTEIVDNTITEADLQVTNLPTDTYVLSYDLASGGFTWVSGGTFATSEAVVESYIFDADNTGTLSSGTIALNSLSYTGNLTVTNGGTGMTSAGLAGGVYYSTGTAFANSGAGSSGNCLLSNGAGAPSWGTCGGGAGTATLQNVYDNGNSITTTDNRNISFILADTAIDSDFIIDLQGTGSLFDIQSSTVSKLMVDGNTGFIGINDSTPSYQLDVNGTGRFTNDLLVDGNATLGNTGTDLITFNGVANSSLQANNVAGATSRTTEATARTNVTTVTITVAGYANGDVIFINNAGQDYYTRIISGGTTTTLTVDTPVSYDASASVQNYTIQNIGAAATGTTFANANRFFQGYFLGGVVTGAGSTTLSDHNLSSTGNLVLQGTSGDVGIGTGTIAPTARLDVQSGNSAYSVNIQNVRGDATGGGLQVITRWNTSANFIARFATNSGTIDVLAIKGDGNVGIGTTTPNAPLQFSNGVASRKIVLWEGANNDHQYYGLGVNSSTFRLQVDATVADFVFYAGTGTTTSTELFRVKGTGAAILAGNLTVNGNGSFIGGTSPTMYFTDSDQETAMIHNNGNTLYFLTGSGAGTTAWALNGGSWPLTINLLDDTSTFGGNLVVEDSGYISITSAQNTSGNLRFSAANPYITASSYFIAPGGAYFNSGTVYAEAVLQARGGVNDDGGSLLLSGSTGKVIVSDNSSCNTVGLAFDATDTDTGFCWASDGNMRWIANNVDTFSIDRPNNKVFLGGGAAVQTVLSNNGSLVFDKTNDQCLGGGGVDDNWLRLTDYTCTNATYTDLAIDNLWAAGAARFDIAEYTPVKQSDNLVPGDIVSADPDTNGQLSRSRSAYDGTVFGIVSSIHSASMVIGGKGPEHYMNGGGKDEEPIALGGRVLVKVSSQNGIIERGDAITTSTIAGTGMKITKAGPIVGKSMDRFDPSQLTCIPTASAATAPWKEFKDPGIYGEAGIPKNECFILPDGTYLSRILVFVMPSWYDPGATDLSQLNVSGPTTLSDLTVTGLAAFKGSLTVAGNADIVGNLSVDGDAEITGNLTVHGDTQLTTLTVTGDTEVQKLTINGKIITAGNAPTVELGQTLTAVLGASITNSGTDTAGTVEVVSGTQASASGEIAEVTFDQAYSSAPKIVMSGNNAKSSKLGAYVVRTATGFKIVTDDPLQLNQTYSFDYIIIEATN